jgi:hypothetical protein
VGLRQDIETARALHERLHDPETAKAVRDLLNLAIASCQDTEKFIKKHKSKEGATDKLNIFTLFKRRKQNETAPAMTLRTVASSAIAKQSGHRAKSTRSARLLWAVYRQKKSIDILQNLTTFVNTLESLVPVATSFAHKPTASYYTDASGDSQRDFEPEYLHGAGLLPTQLEGSLETRVIQEELETITGYKNIRGGKGRVSVVRKNNIDKRINLKLQKVRQRRTQSRASAQHVRVVHVCTLERYASAF